MQRRRFAQLAGAAALGLSVPAFLSRGRDGDEPLFTGATAVHEPFFQRVVVAPGDDPSAISLPVENAHLIEIDRTGALLVHTDSRVRRQRQPRAYQDIDGRRREVSVRFDIAPAGDLRLVIGSYDRTFPLVIEPRGKGDLQP